MTSKAIPWIMLLCVLITGVQWYWFRKKIPSKEKMTYWSILCLCWFLAIMLFLYPRLSGPTDWVNVIFRPLGKMIDQ
ncbi:hypothetical protein [Paenibacillus qinlingensis]|uniref:Cell division protein FtsW (Lipid II flippase) n=1 Tax=Paenibacillus qinlingensis TaxID=1837343 RepID=A0ABU1NP41_9BACL|nr:hypothetical protein [Paenibacillus qinlingensis]MDR6549237.1 cell division protein FtsW (lipid II flippase) [Paenibacillus qinlingensis]